MVEKESLPRGGEINTIVNIKHYFTFDMLLTCYLDIV